MYLGKYYIKKQKWAAAINRFKNILELYGTTIYVEEALHRLVETNYKIGLIEEAEKYAMPGCGHQCCLSCVDECSIASASPDEKSKATITCPVYRKATPSCQCQAGVFE